MHLSRLWPAFKNSVTVEIGYIYWQPFVNISSYFTIIVEVVNSLVLFQQAKQIKLTCGVTLKDDTVTLHSTLHT